MKDYNNIKFTAEECEELIGKFATPTYDMIPRKIEKVFWSTPNGYQTPCFRLEGLDSPLIKAQIYEIK